MDVYLRLIRFLRPYWRQITLGMLCMALGAPLSLAHPLVWRAVVDEGILRARTDTLLPAFALMLGVHLAGLALRTAQQNLLGRVARCLTRDLRNAVFDQLQAQSSEYLGGQKSGDLLARATGDIDLLQSTVVRITDSVLTNLYTLILVAIAVYALSPPLFLFTVPAVLAVWLIVRSFNARVRRLYRTGRELLGEVSVRLQETLAGIQVIKAFAREEEQQARFREATEKQCSVETQALHAQTGFSTTVELVAFAGNALASGLAVYLVVQGRLTLGGLVAFRAYSARLLDPIYHLAQLNDQVQRAAAAGARVFEILDAEVSVQDQPDAHALHIAQGRVCLENVHFAHGPRSVLSGIDLEIAPGEIVGLVGGSGAGKSTLLNLIARFWDPQAGCIRIDGTDIRTITQRSLRTEIAVVLQDSFLFDGTVLDNVRLARPDAPLEEIRAAAAAANALHFVEEELPDGWSTQVGERGVRLSGGQRQRLAIARAFLANPRILLLDEPTSAVEPESEEIIQQALERLAHNRTTLIVSHRLSLLRGADRILVLEDGRIAEASSPEQLLLARTA